MFWAAVTLLGVQFGLDAQASNCDWQCTLTVEDSIVDGPITLPPAGPTHVHTFKSKDVEIEVQNYSCQVAGDVTNLQNGKPVNKFSFRFVNLRLADETVEQTFAGGTTLLSCSPLIAPSNP